MWCIISPCGVGATSPALIGFATDPDDLIDNGFAFVSFNPNEEHDAFEIMQELIYYCLLLLNELVTDSCVIFVFVNGGFVFDTKLITNEAEINLCVLSSGLISKSLLNIGVYQSMNNWC